MMETQGFGRKTFQFETDGNGNAVVHHVAGTGDAASYAPPNHAKCFNQIDKSLYKRNTNIIIVYLDNGKGVGRRAMWIDLYRETYSNSRFWWMF